MPVETIDVYLEVGKKRTFAAALNWPGWSRSGADEESALQALLAYAPRYAQALDRVGIDFQPPADGSALKVVERLPGTSGTDFGAPGAIPSADQRPLRAGERVRFEALLSACWQALQTAAQSAAGRELSHGPRGGGRDVNGIIQHVTDAHRSYLSRLGWKTLPLSNLGQEEALAHIQQASVEGLRASERGELPAAGPRGGARWPAPYFTRRAAWHILDHAWEIEDRIV